MSELIRDGTGDEKQQVQVTGSRKGLAKGYPGDDSAKVGSKGDVSGELQLIELISL